jgi:ureidoglycolate hydrolase
MDVIRLKPQPLSRESFAPYGVVIDRRGSVEIDLGQGAPSMTGATSDRRPFRLEFMARHKRTMQVFSPLYASQAVIVVAPPTSGLFPDRDQVVAFHVDGRWPYAYHKGTWHAPPFATGDWYSYLVVDRSGTLEDDYELVDLKTTCNCVFEIDL